MTTKKSGQENIMDMSLGSLENRIRALHNEYVIKIHDKIANPINEACFLYEVWRIARFYLDMDKNSDQDPVDEFAPVMDSLCQIGCKFGDAYELAMELVSKVSIMKELYLKKGFEGNDLEFIKRYADAYGVVGYICSYFMHYYDSHDDGRIEEIKKENEFLLLKQESNRRAVRRYLNRESVRFGLLLFVCTWLLMVDCHSVWKSVLVSLCAGLMASFGIGFGEKYSESFERVKERIDYFWGGAIVMLIILSGAYIIMRFTCK